MKKATKARRAVKSQVSEVKAEADTLAAKAIDYASDLDYKKLAKNALKIAIPLVVIKMIHSKYKDSKKSHWEKSIQPLFDEIKAKLKDM